MGVPSMKEAPWLMLVFSLPARSASQRVQIWRKLQRYGMLALRTSGYVLPNNAVNQERMEWLATAIRTYKGQASVVLVQGFDDLPAEHIKELFIEARSRDYQKLLHEAKRVLALSPSRRPGGQLNRVRRRFHNRHRGRRSRHRLRNWRGSSPALHPGFVWDGCAVAPAGRRHRWRRA